MLITRRRFLATTGGAVGAALVGCGGRADPAGVVDAAASPDLFARPCSAPSQGPGGGYCLVQSEVLRIRGGASLAVGQVVLALLDDTSAALVARDERGFYGLSAICTHQCCVVTLCDGDCTRLITTPGDCGQTPVGRLARTGAAFVCACHGSEFAADGAVLSGPAIRSLPSVSLTRDGDDLLADLARPAAASDRIQ